jgi:hypothetical protein
VALLIEVLEPRLRSIDPFQCSRAQITEAIGRKIGRDLHQQPGPETFRREWEKHTGSMAWLMDVLFQNRVCY